MSFEILTLVVPKVYGQRNISPHWFYLDIHFWPAGVSLFAGVEQTRNFSENVVEEAIS